MVLVASNVWFSACQNSISVFAFLVLWNLFKGRQTSLNMTYSTQQMSWLQCILRERLSPHVSLSLLSKEFASITIANSTKRIDIALDPSTFTEAGAVLSMGWWNAVAEGWTHQT